MLRIGLMLDSFTTSAWVAKIVDDIQKSDFAHIELLIMDTPTQKQSVSYSRRLRNYWKGGLYFRYEKTDYKYHKTNPDSRHPCDLRASLLEVPVLGVTPIRKGFTDRFSENDVSRIREANLDVIFRFGFRIIRGEILQTAKYGVWSFHHDDNPEYRGGPPLFWEIQERNPVSGTILQILTDSLDGGRVIYRGHSSTNFSSLYLNRNPIYWKTAEYAMRRLRDLHTRGWEFIQSLDTYNEKLTYNRGIYRTPDTLQMTAFLARQQYRRVRVGLSSRLRGGQFQWFLAIRAKSPSRSFDNPSGYRIIRPPNDRFYADPFLMARNGTTFLFFEDFRFKEDRAVISCSEIDSAGNFGEPVEVLRRPYHLSYPFLFEHQGQMYMIPESKSNRTVELYRAEEFPGRWRLEAVLIKDVFAVDATIHVADGRLWMFAGLSNGRFSNSDELGLFYADSLFGPWHPHRGNPVISDVRKARPAGALFRENGMLIRPSQDSAKAYGYALRFSEVLVLNEMEYKERPLAYLGPEWTKWNLGTHTYSRTDDFEAIDGKFAARIRAGTE
jgi:hypothetical protein